MAPTAAMLILTRYSKSSSSAPSLQPCSSGGKVSMVKSWISEHSPLISFNPRSSSDHHHKRESITEDHVADHHDHADADAAFEKRFRQALELSCW